MSSELNNQDKNSNLLEQKDIKIGLTKDEEARVFFALGYTFSELIRRIEISRQNELKEGKMVE